MIPSATKTTSPWHMGSSSVRLGVVQVLCARAVIGFRSYSNLINSMLMVSVSDTATTIN